MTQLMDGGRRGLDGPVTPHALIFVCHSLVLSVDELSSTDIFH